MDRLTIMIWLLLCRTSLHSLRTPGYFSLRGLLCGQRLVSRAETTSSPDSAQPFSLPDSKQKDSDVIFGESLQSWGGWADASSTLSDQQEIHPAIKTLLSISDDDFDNARAFLDSVLSRIKGCSFSSSNVEVQLFDWADEYSGGLLLFTVLHYCGSVRTEFLVVNARICVLPFSRLFVYQYLWSNLVLPMFHNRRSSLGFIYFPEE